MTNACFTHKLQLRNL